MAKPKGKRGRPRKGEFKDELGYDPSKLGPEQLEAPGMETPTVPEVERAGRLHAKHVDAFKSAGTKQKESKAQLIELMQQYDIKKYDRHGVHVTVTETFDVKVEIE